MTKVVFKSRRTPSETIVTKENQAMTIPTPIKETNPSLYARHVKHFAKAKAFTYNYYPQDEVILENYSTMTKKEIAHMLNEYTPRIQYRVNVLQALGLLARKKFQPTKLERTLKDLNQKKMYHQSEARKANYEMKKVLKAA